MAKTYDVRDKYGRRIGTIQDGDPIVEFGIDILFTVFVILIAAAPYIFKIILWLISLLFGMIVGTITTLGKSLFESKFRDKFLRMCLFVAVLIVIPVYLFFNISSTNYVGPISLQILIPLIVLTGGLLASFLFDWWKGVGVILMLYLSEVVKYSHLQLE